MIVSCNLQKSFFEISILAVDVLVMVSMSFNGIRLAWRRSITPNSFSCATDKPFWDSSSCWRIFLHYNEYKQINK